MNSASLKKIVPKSIKRPLKELVKRRQLRTAIKNIRKLPAGQVPSRELLSQLISGWGNDGYAANLDYLEEVAKQSLSCDGPILECGSGASTILLGILSARRQLAV